MIEVLAKPRGVIILQLINVSAKQPNVTLKLIECYVSIISQF